MAAQMPPDFCFPFQHESETILRRAMESNPDDARAPYDLGNLLFDNQPPKAIAAWETAVKLDGNFAPARRNLAFALAQARNDVSGAIPHLEKAVSLEPGNPRLYYELDVLYEWAGTGLQKRLDALNRRPEVVAKRDDALTRRIVLLTAAGATGEALDILRTHHFRNWEGSSSLHGIYVDTCLQSAMRHRQKGEHSAALVEIRAAMDYPANQEIGKSARKDLSARIEYCLGREHEVMGQGQSAQEAFRSAADSSEREGSEAGYFRGLAMLKVGREHEAKELFQEMEQRGLGQLDHGKETVDYFAKFGEKRAERVRLAQAHYIVGLARLGLSRRAEAEESFAKALELDPAHLGALTWQLF
jgi:tetratricopeptide (TPR) repeat protein